jgi:hypothetical protein
MLVDVPQASTDWRRRGETALVLRFRKKTQQTVMAGLDPAIRESQVDAVPARGCPALGPREARTRGPGMTTEATSESSECI